MSKIFVIAGTNHEANDWIRRNMEKRHISGTTTLSRSEYVYVADPIVLRGFRDPHGVFIGTWRERKDIEQVIETLLQQSVHVNKSLEMLRKEVAVMKHSIVVFP
jgi:hypothetical protein